jgi:L-threonate 2-dehydrogenase
MTMRTVAILAPGDMGHAVGACLVKGGARVITNLTGRSALTADRAKRVGFEDVADDARLVREAEIVLSICPPSEVRAIAQRVAAAINNTGAKPLYVDCNAVSAPTVRAVGDIVTATGAAFVDAGIIGMPPKPGEKKTRFYASGSAAPRFAVLNENGLDIRVIEGGIGGASALKMCYASMTKGLSAIMAQAFVSAGKLGVAEALKAEMRLSNPGTLQRAQEVLPTVTYRAYRWVAEMEEIAATFADAGMSPRLFQGAADTFRQIADSPLGELTPESPLVSFEEFCTTLAASARKEAAE